MIPVQIDYTSRDYSALRSELINVIKARIPSWSGDDNADFSVALVDAFSYLGDVMSYYIDRVANESQIQTTTQKSNLINFAEIVGYRPSGPNPATATVTFLNSTSSAVLLPAGTQVYVQVSLNDGNLSNAYFETITDASIPANSSSTLDVIEGKTSNTDNTSDGIDPSTFQVLPKTIGTSNGYAYQEFVIPNDLGIIDYSTIVYVGQVASFSKWTYYDNLLDATPYTNAFTTRLNEDGTTSIIFGDGINGTVPLSGQLIGVIYRTSIGVAGNITSSSNPIVSFIPGIGTNTDGITASFGSYPSGGTDGETLASLRQNIKHALSSRNRAVTTQDYVSLGSLVPGVGRVSVMSDVYTNVSLFMQPYYDSTLTPGITQSTAVATISAISGNGTNVSVTTSAPHGFKTGSTVQIANVTTTTAYNGTYPFIRVVDSTHFTYESTTTGTGAVSGTTTATNTLSVPTTAWNYIKKSLYQYLIPRMPVNSSLTISPPSYATINLALTITIDNAYKQSDVKANIAKVLLDSNVGLFSYGGFGFGSRVTQSAIHSVLMLIPGIKYVSISTLARPGSTGVADIGLYPNEIPVLYPANLTLNLTGGV
jgi:uncharacterized phage protein gp47/JayE